MALDAPWIDYQASRNTGSSTSGRGSTGNNTELTAKQAEAMWARWEKSRGGKTFAGRKHLTIDEIFSEA